MMWENEKRRKERAIVIDSLLRTLNPPDPEVDRRWAMVAKRRLTELRAGQVQPVPGDEVFARTKERFAVETEYLCPFF